MLVKNFSKQIIKVNSEGLLASQGNSVVENKADLGQVFTSKDLANFMVSLLGNSINNSSEILDPCIGPNTFFSALDKINKTPKLTGIEIDKKLINDEVENYFINKNGKLLHGNFLNYPLSNKFDYVIQNPPYVRQELLTSGSNSKEAALKIINNCVKTGIPAQSNLYVYFLIKSILHLKDNGVMVAVIYDSWLYSSFGKWLRKTFNELGHIKKIYHFKRNAFENAEIGATVIYFKRLAKIKSKTLNVNYYELDSVTVNNLDLNVLEKCASILSLDKFEEYNFNAESSLDFECNFFTTIKAISSQPIQRGTSSIANGHFLHTSKKFDESLPIIKDVAKIETYEVIKETAYILAIGESLSEATSKYLRLVESEIITAGDKYKAVKNRILNRELWHKVKLKKPGNFIFNYYLRNNIDFILNDSGLMASDNFYIINIPYNQLANLAILNSAFTKIAVLAHSRNQGNGLRKVQLFEFKEIPIIKIEFLEKKTIDKLKLLGGKLAKTNRYDSSKSEILKKIDKILISEYNRYAKLPIDLDTLENELRKYYI